MELDELETRRKRLCFRANHRGTKEADILVGGFANEHLQSLSPEQLDRFEALLNEVDTALYEWIIGKTPVPDRLNHDVMQMIQSFKLKF